MSRHNKNRGKHTSLSKAVKRNLEKIDTHKGVKKVIIGVSTGRTHSHAVGTIRVQRIEEGQPVIHLAAYGDKGISNLTVICNTIDDVTPTVDFIARLS
jgi:hypothetical protein